jgi:hypothetical protein
MTLYKGMTEFYVVPALGAIAKMAQQAFAQEGDMALHQPRVLHNIGLVFFQLFYFMAYFRKYIRYRLVFDASCAV